jgi:hypothetical protein
MAQKVARTHSITAQVLAVENLVRRFRLQRSLRQIHVQHLAAASVAHCSSPRIAQKDATFYANIDSLTSATPKA